MGPWVCRFCNQLVSASAGSLQVVMRFRLVFGLPCYQPEAVCGHCGHGL